MGRVIKITTKLLQHGYEYEPIEAEQTAIVIKPAIPLSELTNGSYLQTVSNLREIGLGVTIDLDYDDYVFRIKVF